MIVECGGLAVASVKAGVDTELIDWARINGLYLYVGRAVARRGLQESPLANPVSNWSIQPRWESIFYFLEAFSRSRRHRFLPFARVPSRDIHRWNKPDRILTIQNSVMRL
jgi:hypothetical protein